ncbi:ATP-dependent nuclease [Streptomyces sp. CA-142005]|uniref:ATP-dependent nuclease n=1 Tax=Streptomyces sp. CA-142005 TaxID=3240052 RepID=UPI003D8CFA1E
MPEKGGHAMRINSLHATGFRSIRNATLEGCGQLNVLIGKNNSGKSNILEAVRVFFDFFKSEGAVTSVSPEVSRTTDWHLRETDEPVRISATLSLDDEEMEDLKESISSEAPQMRNALFGAPLGSLIKIELCFIKAPINTGYVSLIEFEGSPLGASSKIFSMGGASAIDIAKAVSTEKSTLSEIDAIERLSRLIDADDWRRTQERGSSINPMIRHTIDRIGKHQGALLRIVRGANSYSDFQRNCRDQMQHLLEKVEQVTSAPIEHPLTTFSGDSPVVPDYVSSLIRKIAGLRVHSLSENRRPIGEEEASRILKLKTSRGQGDVLLGIQSVVSSLLGVQIDAFSSDEPELPSKAGVVAELDVDDFLVQVNGSGIRESLRLILDREFEKPHVMLVEEPEVHLHPALETALMQYMTNVSKDCQIFLTTHSTNFLDVGSLKNVYMVRKDPDTVAQLLDVGEAEEAIPQELGIRLSSLFMFDRLVFVEGPSDEQIIRTFADTLNCSFGQAALGFVTTGGARNFTHYAMSATLSFLRRRNVRTIFVLDRDERSNEDFEKMQGRVEGVSEVKFLDRREMENYLLCPSALSRFIAEKSNGASQPSAEEVRDVLDEVSDELLATAIERRVLKQVCKPFIPDRNKVIKRGEEDFAESVRKQLEIVRDELNKVEEGLSSLYGSASDEVSAEWSSKKMSIAPGDEILNLLFKRFDLSFNKRSDGLKIAALMTESDIPIEMKSLIRDLVQ